jgi:hypothetical protein
MPSPQISPSPQRSVVARTPSPPTVVEAPNNPFADNVTPPMASWQVDADANTDAILNSVPRYIATKYAEKNNYAKQYAMERLLARQEDQKQRRVFSDLQEQDNRQKLRRPFSRSYTPVPMGLPLTSEEWLTHSATWHEKHEEKRIIDVVSPENDKMDAYYFEGTKLYKVRTDESYDREDRDLAASLRRNATAAAAAATAATDAWE